jgi:hypothetical protein
MISAKNIIELLEREKLVAYFALLWGGSFFFWNLASEFYYVFNMTSAFSALAFVSNLSELIAGIMLALLGFKLLGNTFLPTLTKEKLLVFFLLFWALSFILWSIYDIVGFGSISAESALRFLGALCDLGAGAILGLLSLKLYNSTVEPLPPPPPQ